MISNTFHNLWDTNTLYSAEVHTGSTCVSTCRAPPAFWGRHCASLSRSCSFQSQRGQLGFPACSPVQTRHVWDSVCLSCTHLLLQRLVFHLATGELHRAGPVYAAGWQGCLERRALRHGTCYLCWRAVTNKTRLELTTSLKRLISSMGVKGGLEKLLRLNDVWAHNQTCKTRCMSLQESCSLEAEPTEDAPGGHCQILLAGPGELK